MPKMHIPWSFQPWDGPMYHCGTQEVEDRHVAAALSLGGKLIEEPVPVVAESAPSVPETVTVTLETAAPQLIKAKAPDVVTPAKSHKNPALQEAADHYRKQLSLAKELGLTGTAKKADVIAFLIEKGVDPETLEKSEPETPQEPAPQSDETTQG